MKLALIALAWLFVPSSVGAAGGIAAETNVSSFVHQITIQPDSVRMRQIVSPLHVQLPFLGGRLEAHAAAIYVERTVTTSGRDTTNSVWSPSDAEISATWDLRRAIVSAHVSVPSGKDGLSGSDSLLVRDLYRNDLNFPVSHLGRGLDLGGAVSVGHQDGQVGYSVGMSYLRRGEYRPFGGSAEYKPGDQVSASAGIEYTRGGWRAEADIVGTFIFTDRADGLVVFQNGKQIATRGALSYHAPGLLASISVYDVVRFKDRQLDDRAMLVFEEERSNGNDARASARVAWTPHAAATVFGTGLIKDVRQNGQPRESLLFQDASRIYGYGGGASVAVGRNERLLVELQRQVGWIDGGLTDLDIWHGRVSLRLQF